MPITEIVLIALGLSMDAFAVSVAAGLSLQRNCFPHALQRGVVFGSFQAVMPVLGWLGGLGFRPILEPLDHWIAFGLLAIIGLHMIFSSWKSADSAKHAGGFVQLIVLGIATSIDALAIGLTFALLGVRILFPVLVIGATTFFMSFGGVYLGQRVGRLFARRIEAIGGLILILIGIRILVKHLAAGI
ncbi:MAG: manganese efflux pump [Candidatus Aminicenantes bacterium]|nr:manganese efflux pump [Candidatus Aminicenantes bacterium]